MSQAAVKERPVAPTLKRVLSVGGSDIVHHPLPPHYAGFKQEVLDIDPKVKPDLCCDAREMTKQPGGIYDAIFCSHNLEHYHPHDVSKVLKGFLHMLKPEGYAEIWVPDMNEILTDIVTNKRDMEDVMYTSNAGPIYVRDLIFGFGAYIARDNKDYYAHKMGFTEKSLREYALKSGFLVTFNIRRGMKYDMGLLAFKQQPTEEHFAFFGIRKDQVPPM